MGTESTIDGVGRTAFNVAYWRSEEARQPNPLFVDPYAVHFATDDVKGHADKVERLLPEAKTMIRYRTRYMDDLVAVWSAAGVQQVLLLGAGLDTRSLRCNAPGVRFFEVDQAGTLDFKQRVLARAGFFFPSVFVPCDYVAEDLNARMRSADFDPGLLTLVIWEGNTYYLPPDAVLQTLQRLSELMPRFILTLDYVSEGLINRSTGAPRLDLFVDVIAKMGTPWTSGFRDAEPMAQVLGARVLEDLTTPEVITRLGRNEPDRDEAVLAQHSVAVLQRA